MAGRLPLLTHGPGLRRLPFRPESRLRAGFRLLPGHRTSGSRCKARFEAVF